MAELRTDRAASQKSNVPAPVASHDLGAKIASSAGSANPPRNPGRLRSFVRSIYLNDLRLQIFLFAFLLFFYGALMWGAWGRSEQTVAWNYTFNSMLAHLMHGQFDVDPQIVGWEEGFLRNGRTYTYFGIWCALLRLPLWVMGRMDIDLTLCSCIAAASLAGIAKVRALLVVRRYAVLNPIAGAAVNLMLLYVLFGGSGISNLNASIYLEVILWAYAFAAAFVCAAVTGIVKRAFSLRALCLMALCAGLALNTRVSTGIGLVLAFVLLLIALAAFPLPSATTGSAASRLAPARNFLRALASRSTILPAGILSAFIAVSGMVNYFRWGNPLTFANWDLYLNWAASPGSSAWWLSPVLSQMHAYGEFNLVRVPFNLFYYFCPFWALHATDSGALLASSLGRTMAGIELPPGSFFLTDVFAFCFVALLARALWQRGSRVHSPAARWAAAVALGLLAPCILMLTAMWVAYRYRMEFYPEFEFLAFFGLYLTVTDARVLARFARIRNWIAAALVLNIACSFFFLFLVDVSLPMPPAYGGRPLVAYYRMVSAEHVQQFITRHFPSHR